MIGKKAMPRTEGTFEHGTFRIDTPATAEIRVSVSGYAPVQKSIFLDYPILDATLRLRAEDLTEWKTFERMRDLLKDVHLEFALAKAAL